MIAKRYHIDFSRLARQFVPHYMGGRNVINFVTASLHPLQSLSDAFAAWAHERTVEASTTAQIYRLEWFLSRKFSASFASSSAHIVIGDGMLPGKPMYYEAAVVPDDRLPVLYFESENVEDGFNLDFMFPMGQPADEVYTSFKVSSPPLAPGVDKEEYETALRYWVNRYRPATKTFTIIYQNR